MNIAHTFLSEDGRMSWPNGLRLSDNVAETTQNQHTVFKTYFNEFFHPSDLDCINIISVDDVPKDEKYIFPIYVEISLFWCSKYLNEPLYIPENVLTDIKTDRARLCFVMIKEGQAMGGNKSLLIQNQIKFLNLDYKHVYYIDANLKSKEINIGYPLKRLHYNYFGLVGSPLNSIDEIVDNISNKQIRKYKFLSFNNIARDFRAILIHRLIQLNIDKNSILTCSEKFEQSLFSQQDTVIGQEFYSIQDKNEFPKIFDFDINVKTVNPTDINLDAHINSYINICTETSYATELDRMYFSEKIFKPIIALQPFILVGQCQSLEYLRQLGYMTFHPYIDETYDQEKNDTKRLAMIVNEVVRLDQMTNEQLSELLVQLKSILIYNESIYRRNKDFKIEAKAVIKEIYEMWDYAF
jgi:hypothetical protein